MTTLDKKNHRCILYMIDTTQSKINDIISNRNSKVSSVWMFARDISKRFNARTRVKSINGKTIEFHLRLHRHYDIRSFMKGFWL